MLGILREKIKHVVVLMLENRSFDCLLGQLHINRPDFNGLVGTESNPHTGGPVSTIPVWNDETNIPGTMTIPTPDPGELFADINMQLFGFNGAPNNHAPPMNGFVDNYVRQTEAPPCEPKQTMHYYTPGQVPVISQLANAYAVCDQWHASAPNQTWPNRFFVHCATAGGYINNSPPHFPYLMPTIQGHLNAIDNGWKVYFHDIPQSLALARLWTQRASFRRFEEFAADAAAGQLPCYSFIEPRYFADVGLGMPNDQHPPHDVIFGEQLIASVYNTVRLSPLWDNTLLIVTYDEHGGCYDHAPPPLAVSPGDDRLQDGFAFDRYGVRVPAIIISPYIEPGTILRSAAAGLPHVGPPYPYDHASVVATLRKCFNLGGALTNRDNAAPDLDAVLNLDAPTNNQLPAITVPAYVPSQKDLQDAIGRPLTDIQIALHRLASILPAPGADLDDHIKNLASGATRPIEPAAIVADAKSFIADRMVSFFG
jgi:phospholipase C